MLLKQTQPYSFQAAAHHLPVFEQPGALGPTLKFLSFNIQVGIRTQAMHHYVTRSWQHVLPHSKRQKTLDNIAQTIQGYDFVALQEVDGGSFRSNYTNQVHYLAQAARFPYWYQQLNRNLGMLAQHSNGLLSRHTPTRIEDHRLPGLLPGRGAITASFGPDPHKLLLIILHLSLGKRTRFRQLEYIRDLIGDHHSVVLMGDLNCHQSHLLEHTAFSDCNLQNLGTNLLTYPSWRPTHAFDHILVSDNLQIIKTQVLDLSISDHRPISLEIKTP
ncbi:endonuclease/exonuclease/phosphatase family protein [Motiliproteus sp. MSK22-1]|uniref:endonuclease/exonuclease/phosphatase family protein n=1 Tax=Motiliproteus sp. MSK22-1 TaxID=1897630 RepID=UPI0009FB03D4|nr:endonuclease/exonuclease/phosphatase family protein [Motiliproteus sp. MSK22-1]